MKKLHDFEATCPVTGKHHQKVIRFNGERILVDEHLAPLIDGLLRLGIFTFSSCQAGCGGACRRKHKRFPDTRELVNGREECIQHYKLPKLCKRSVWLVFVSMTDVTKFVNLVYRKTDSNKLREQMSGVGVSQSLAWNFHVTMTDLNDQRYIDHRGFWVGKKSSPPKMGFYCHLVIPRAHLQLVTDRILQACKKRGK